MADVGRDFEEERAGIEDRQLFFATQHPRKSVICNTLNFRRSSRQMDRNAKGFDIDNFHTFQDIQKHLLELEGMMTQIYKRNILKGINYIFSHFLNYVAKHPEVSTQIIGKSSEGRDLR